MTMHGDGTVQMNGVSAPDNGQNTGYNETLVGLRQRRSATAAPSSSTRRGRTPVQLREFGSGRCEACHDGTVSLAPDVMELLGRIDLRPDGGHGDADGSAAVECTACHDINLPATPDHGAARHRHLQFDLGQRLDAAARTPRTSRPDFFTKYPAIGAGGSSVQVAMDNYCTWECHDPNRNDVKDTGEPTKAMRERRRRTNRPGDNIAHSVKFGTHQTPPKSAEQRPGHPCRHPDRRRPEHGRLPDRELCAVRELSRPARHRHREAASTKTQQPHAAVHVAADRTTSCARSATSSRTRRNERRLEMMTMIELPGGRHEASGDYRRLPDGSFRGQRRLVAGPSVGCASRACRLVSSRPAPPRGRSSRRRPFEHLLGFSGTRRQRLFELPSPTKSRRRP